MSFNFQVPLNRVFSNIQGINITSNKLKKDYTVLLIQLDGNLASDVSTRCSGHVIITCAI